MSLAILFHFSCAQHVSDINVSIIRNLRLILLNYHIGLLFLVRCVLEFQCGWFGVVSVLQAGQHTSNQEQHDQCGNSTEESQAPDDGYINV